MEVNNIIVSGSSPQTYFAVRLLSKVNPKISLVTNEKKCAFYSRFGEKTLIEDYDSYLKLLMSVDNNTSLYVCSGRDIQSLMERDSDFFKRDNVFPNDMYGLQYFADKIKTYELCREIGLPTIQTRSLEFDNFDIFSSCKVIVKWNVENTTDLLPSFKTDVLNNVGEIENFRSKIPEEIRSKIIVQTYIDSELGSNISFLGYYTKGELVAGLLAQQLEQYPLGITSRLTEYRGPLDKKLVESAKKLVLATKFNGFCEVEFKIEKGFRNFYILEVNPRPCGWASALLGKYSNLDRLLLNPSETPMIAKEKLRWINIIRFARGRLSKGFFPFIKGVFLVPFFNCYDIFNFYDPRPFFSQIIRRRKP